MAEEKPTFEWVQGEGYHATYKGKSLRVYPVGGEGEFDGSIDGKKHAGTNDEEETQQRLIDIVDGTYVEPSFSGLQWKPELRIVPMDTEAFEAYRSRQNPQVKVVPLYEPDFTKEVTASDHSVMKQKN